MPRPAKGLHLACAQARARAHLFPLGLLGHLDSCQDPRNTCGSMDTVHKREPGRRISTSASARPNRATGELGEFSTDPQIVR